MLTIDCVDHLRNAEKDLRPEGRETMQLNASKRSGELVGATLINSHSVKTTQRMLTILGGAEVPCRPLLCRDSSDVHQRECGDWRRAVPCEFLHHI